MPDFLEPPKSNKAVPALEALHGKHLPKLKDFWFRLYPKPLTHRV